MHLKVSISEAAHCPTINMALTPENAEHNDQRLVYASVTHPVQMPVYRRGGLPVGSRFFGPEIIEEIDSTTFLPRRRGTDDG